MILGKARGAASATNTILEKVIELDGVHLLGQMMYVPYHPLTTQLLCSN